MTRIAIALAGLTLCAASGLAAARDCRQYAPREGAYDNTRREARYDDCVKRERERNERRAERDAQRGIGRDARKPVDMSPNAPPPDRMVQPMQSK